MKSLFSMIPSSIRRFHENEEGDAIQVVMILAIAAMVLIVLIAVGQDVVTWAKGWIDKVIHGNEIK